MTCTPITGEASDDRAEVREPRNVVGVDHLEVGQVRPGVAPPVRGAGRLALDNGWLLGWLAEEWTSTNYRDRVAWKCAPTPIGQ